MDTGSNNIKIGIVEDDLLMSQLISNTLINLGYNITSVASNYDDAIKMIENEKPDILLLDIYLEGDKSGIDVAETLNKKYNLPFIFLTANAGKETLEQAKKVNPPAFLVKPFNNNDLYASIEICLNNFLKPPVSRADNSEYFNKDFVFIKDGYYFYKIKFNDIYFIESDHVYINIFTNAKKMTVRSSLGHFLDNINKEAFVKVHRSYAVNLNHIDSISTDHLMIKGHKVPTSKKYREEVLARFQVI
ncbi:MAG: response regulator [Flavobacteriales bacterium]|nr:response regulator [Flavobacteriales bacterium]